MNTEVNETGGRGSGSGPARGTLPAHPGFQVSGFCFLLSGFWFLVSGFGLDLGHYLCSLYKLLVSKQR